MSQKIQITSRLTTRELCQHLTLSYGTLLRWRRRATNGLPLLRRPGPKKLGPLPFEKLRQEVGQLLHNKKRTAGSGALYTKYRDLISRRDLSALINQQRRNQTQQRRRNFTRITWKEPNLAWSIDATEYGRDKTGRKLYVIATQDLASRYSFAPLVTIDPSAQQVVAYLRQLFHRHGRPLFFKRDNGSLFNNHSLDELLAKECVLPLNSPAAYPPYNGAIEKAIRELKENLAPCLPPTIKAWQPSAVAPLANAATHLRNCRPRRSLGGHTAAEVYHRQIRSRFGRRQRHLTFEWITMRSNVTIQNTEKTDRRSIHAAWRHAAVTWLRRQGLISLSVNPKVLPHLS
jgi:hypothetical protein